MIVIDASVITVYTLKKKLEKIDWYVVERACEIVLIWLSRDESHHGANLLWIYYP